MDKKLVKFRKDGDRFLVYVPEHRKTIAINETGKFILEKFLNQGNSVKEVAAIMAKEFNEPLGQFVKDVETFLKKFKEQLTTIGTALNERRQLDSPMTAEIEITQSCNLKCAHCLHGLHHPVVHMPVERARNIIKILAENQVWEISIMGGEPFMHPHLIELLKICQEHSMAINLVTNATLIDDKTADELAEISNLVVLVSLDGMEAGHERIRGKGNYKKTLIAIERLRSRKIPFSINFTLNALNLDEYKQTVDYWSSRDIVVNFNIFKPFTKKHWEMIISPETYFSASSKLFDMMSEGSMLGLSNVAIMAEMLDSEPQSECRATLSGLVLDIEGRMITCPSLMSSGYYNRNDLPNILDGDFVETWRNHPFFKEFRKFNLRECPGRAHIFSQDVKGNDPYGIEAFTAWRCQQ